MPRVDSASVFGRLLDADRGGFCAIWAGDAAASRRYLGDSLVLETTLRSASGEARLLDCFTMLKRRGIGTYVAIGGNDGLLVTSDIDLQRVDQHDLVASFAVRAASGCASPSSTCPPRT
jgi:hypothetical protein